MGLCRRKFVWWLSICVFVSLRVCECIKNNVEEPFVCEYKLSRFMVNNQIVHIFNWLLLDMIANQKPCQHTMSACTTVALYMIRPAPVCVRVAYQYTDSILCCANRFDHVLILIILYVDIHSHLRLIWVGILGVCYLILYCC